MDYIENRSNTIKIIVPFVLLLIYYLRLLINLKFLEFLRLLFFIIPLVFFTLGVLNIFNVFKMDEYMNKYNISVTNKNSKGDIIETDLTDDTRSPLYEEVLQNAKKFDSWILGRSPAHGNESGIFANSIFEVTKSNERSSNEAAILNAFTWTGTIGVLLYMLVFFLASFLALNRSKNIFSKMLGLYIAFRWFFAWIEDYQSFFINYFFLWILIGFCFSRSFRNMDDKEMKQWINFFPSKK
jgi:hypothetical protein